MKYPLDHYALRVWHIEAYVAEFARGGYRVSEKFGYALPDNSLVKAVALTHSCLPSVFISTPAAIADSTGGLARWLKRYGPGRHHDAYAVDNLQEAMERIALPWNTPVICPCGDPLSQVFSKPSLVTGLTTELLVRGKHRHAFCKHNIPPLQAQSLK